ncbi:MAG: cytochrome P450 [Blastocatellia bacterium]|nr:cytochrome P450 [Blastocatellia bacterium]
MSSTLHYPPGLSSKPLWGNFWLFRRDSIGFLTEAAKKYGDICYLNLGPAEFFLVNHPDYIKEILVTQQKNFGKGRGLQRAKLFLGEGLLTSEGEFHRRQRRLAQPAFHRQRIASYGNVMVDYAERMRDSWQSGTTIDIADEMMKVTMFIVAKTLFDANVEGQASEIGQSLTALVHAFNFILIPFTELLDKLPFPVPGLNRLQKAKERLDVLIYQIIEDRRRSGEDRGDLLSMLLLAQDEEGTGGMTDLQLRDELMTIFLAGHETTANALTWTWYLLSQHPNIEAKMWTEIDALGDRQPTADDLPNLKYTEMVLAESMRLYPPAWTIARRALTDFEIAGYTLPANSIIFISQFVTHHDERFFPDPYKFDPMRWTQEEIAKRPKFSYYPFGGGARVCIGESFAWMEGVLLLVTFAQKWRLKLAPNHVVVPQTLITLRPKYGMKMIVEQRIKKG